MLSLGENGSCCHCLNDEKVREGENNGRFKKHVHFELLKWISLEFGFVEFALPKECGTLSMYFYKTEEQ